MQQEKLTIRLHLELSWQVGSQGQNFMSRILSRLHGYKLHKNHSLGPSLVLMVGKLLDAKDATYNSLNRVADFFIQKRKMITKLAPSPPIQEVKANSAGDFLSHLRSPQNSGQIDD
jgi:hypothetical protein